eukprot:gene7151-467_t
MERCRKVFEIQQRRLETYALLDRHFNQYLKEGSGEDSFSTYRQRVHEATEEFKTLSSEILAIIHTIDENNEMFDLLNRLQELEEDKLHKVVQHQFANINPSIKTSGLESKRQISNIDQDIAELMIEIRYELD